MNVGRFARFGRSRPRKMSRLAAIMPEWAAWLLTGVALSLGVFLLWLGLAIVVRSERMPGGNVDVTLERRFLGLFAVNTRHIPNVIKADLYYVFSQTGRDGRQERGSTVALRLTSLEGRVVTRTRFGPSIGTRPQTVAARMEQFIRGGGRTITGPTLTLWWMPWLANLAAIALLAFSLTLMRALLRQRHEPYR